MKDGLVVCADTLSVCEIDGPMNNYRKVHKASRSLGFGIVGHVQVKDAHSRKVLYDAYSVIKAYFKSRRISGYAEIDWPALKQTLVDDLKRYLRIIPIALRPQLKTMDNGGFNTVVIFGKVDGLVKCSAIYLYSDDPNELDSVQSEVRDFHDTPNGYGEPAVLMEIARGTRPEFDEIRQELIISTFLRPPDGHYRSEEITQGEALQFGRLMIDVTNRYSRFLNASEPTVGETCDSVIMHKHHGFDWETLRSTEPPFISTFPAEPEE